MPSFVESAPPLHLHANAAPRPSLSDRVVCIWGQIAVGTLTFAMLAIVLIFGAAATLGPQSQQVTRVAHETARL